MIITIERILKDHEEGRPDVVRSSKDGSLYYADGTIISKNDPRLINALEKQKIFKKMCPDLIYRIVPYGIPPRLKMTPEQRITPQIHRTLADRFTMPVSCRLSEKVHNPQNAAVTLLQTTTGTKIEIGVSAKVHEYFTAKGTGATAHLLEKDQQLQLGYLLDNTLVAIVKMIPTSYKR